MRSKCFEYSFYLLDKEAEVQLKDIQASQDLARIRICIEKLNGDLEKCSYTDFKNSFPYKYELYLSGYESVEEAGTKGFVPPTYEESFYTILYNSAVRDVTDLKSKAAAGKFGKNEREKLLYYIIKSGNPYKRLYYFLEPDFYFSWDFAEALSESSPRIKSCISDHDHLPSGQELLATLGNAEFNKAGASEIAALAAFADNDKEEKKKSYGFEYSFFSEMITQAREGTLSLVHKLELPDY